MQVQDLAEMVSTFLPSAPPALFGQQQFRSVYTPQHTSTYLKLLKPWWNKHTRKAGLWKHDHSSQHTSSEGQCCCEPTARAPAGWWVHILVSAACASLERGLQEWPGRVQRRELLWQPRPVLALPLGLASDDDSFAPFELSDGARGLTSAGSCARQSAPCLHHKNLWELSSWLQGLQHQVPWSNSLYNQLEKHSVVSFKSHWRALHSFMSRT